MKMANATFADLIHAARCHLATGDYLSVERIVDHLHPRVEGDDALEDTLDELTIDVRRLRRGKPLRFNVEGGA